MFCKKVLTIFNVAFYFLVAATIAGACLEKIEVTDHLVYGILDSFCKIGPASLLVAAIIVLSG